MGHTSHIPDLGQPDGIATLDGGGSLPAAQAPPNGKYSRGYGLFSANAFFIESTSASWTAVTEFRFPGTATANPDTVKMILALSSGAGNMGARIYDATNGNPIVEIDPLAVTAVPLIYDLGTVSSLPASEAIFEVQVRKVASGKPRIAFFEIFEA